MNKFLVTLFVMIFSVGAMACNGHGKQEEIKKPESSSKEVKE